ERVSFDFLCIISAQFRSFLHGLDRCYGCRIVTPRLSANKHFGAFKGEQAFHVIVSEWCNFLFASLAIRELVRRGSAQDFGGARQEVGGTYQPINHTAFKCCGTFILVAAGDPFDCGVQSSKPGESYRTAPTGYEPKFGFGKADLSAVAHNAKVARETNFQPTSERIAINGG